MTKELNRDEPVAYFNPQKGGFYWAKPTTVTAPITVDVEPLPLYTTPQQGCAECGANGGYALYCLVCAERFVSSKEWVGLTESERNDVVWSNTRADDLKEAYDVAVAIEQALRNKNT